MTYNRFALYYDELMSDVPYHLWVDFVHEHVKVTSSSATLLDMGCGTGTLALLLARQGYQVTGIDLSEDMLAIAERKASEQGMSLSLSQRTMTDLSGFGQYDCIVSFCDSLNYLLQESDVLQTFKQVYDHLVTGGYFLFDVHSIFKINELFIGHTFASNDDHLPFIWRSFAGDCEHQVEHDLTFFVKEGDVYHRFDECHVQQTFPIERYQNLLNLAGFTNIKVIGDFTNFEVAEAERVFFVVQK